MNDRYSLQRLNRNSVNRAGEAEVVRQSLYDFQTYPAAGQTQMIFFQVPQGQAGKTKFDTNMEVAGSLPAPKRFIIETIEIEFFPGGLPSAFGAPTALNNVNDVYTFSQNGFLDLFIGSKSYLTEAPLGRFPSSNRMAVNAAFADASTAAANLQSRSGYASLAGAPYRLEPNIALVATQNFSVSLNWPTAIALPSTVNARVGVVMKGLLYRNSQ